jgi:hypothetical protein
MRKVRPSLRALTVLTVFAVVLATNTRPTTLRPQTSLPAARVGFTVEAAWTWSAAFAASAAGYVSGFVAGGLAAGIGGALAGGAAGAAGGFAGYAASVAASDDDGGEARLLQYPETALDGPSIDGRPFLEP